MTFEEIREKIKKAEEELRGIDFYPYVVNVWDNIVKPQGVLVPEVRDRIEAKGFEMVHSFRGDDRDITYYVWRKGDIEITLHTT
mgnify:CR=1 FL=1